MIGHDVIARAQFRVVCLSRIQFEGFKKVKNVWGEKKRIVFLRFK